MGSKLPWPLPGCGLVAYGTSADHVERLGPGRYAIDLAAPLGTAIPLLPGWTPGEFGEDSERGRWIWAYSTDAEGVEWWALYCHLAHWLPAPGVLGTVGLTGNTTGPHLHYVLYRNGERVRPEDWLQPEPIEEIEGLKPAQEGNETGNEGALMPRTERQQAVIAGLRERAAYLRQLAAELRALQHGNYAEALEALGNQCDQDAERCAQEWPEAG